MVLIGVVGGIASGKSFVTEYLGALGAVVLDADQIGHQVLLQDAVKSAIRDNWGMDVFTSSGEVDRGKLAAIVFDTSQPNHLKKLESITHPRIGEQIALKVQQLQESGNFVAILDAPVMVKAGWYKLCNHILFVDTDEQMRWQRASQRGWSREMFENREKMQASVLQKREVSTWAIDNNGSPEETKVQLDKFWRQVVETTKTPNATDLRQQT